MHKQPSSYIGIDQDIDGGMTDIGKIIRDAWIFGLIPETETCAGWSLGAIERLWQDVNDSWASHGFQVGRLPPETRERFDRIQQAAQARARAAGWDPDRDIESD